MCPVEEPEALAKEKMSQGAERHRLPQPLSSGWHSACVSAGFISEFQGAVALAGGQLRWWDSTDWGGGQGWNGIDGQVNT